MPMGMTLSLRTRGPVPGLPFARDFLDGLLGELASRAGIPAGELRSRPPPFSVSSLMPAEGGRTAGAACRTEKFRLRLGWLADADLKGLVDWARALRAHPVEVGTNGAPVIIEDAIVSSTLIHRWNRCVPYERMYEEASDCHRLVTLKFCSATVLERSGHPYPLPDPRRVFLGYARLWDRFSGVPLSPGLREALDRQLLLVDFRIRRRNTGTGTGSLPGFVGSATFRLEGRHPERTLRGLNVLADYAFFCGTGIGTEKGLGLTRRIPRPEAHGPGGREAGEWQG